jgi:two-component system chemotaxis response regulator CheY
VRVTPQEQGAAPEQGVARALIAARNEDQRMLMRHALESDGRFEVVSEAEDGAAAVALALVDQPDVLVLDHELAHLTGLEVARKIAEQGPGAVVILLTGDERVESEARATVQGVRGKSGGFAWLPDALSALIDASGPGYAGNGAL